MALANQIGLSSKYVSERHALASQSKFTAGEVNKILKKKGITTSAKEIVEAYSLLGRRAEWHHSGFYKSNGKSTMGRTFFFDEEDVEFLVENWRHVEEKKAAIEAEETRKSETKVQGFAYTWDYDYSGAYGKRRNYKVLRIYEGDELNQPKNFTALTPGEFLSAKLSEGKSYYGWDEPTASEFESISKIKYNRILKERIEAKQKAEDDKKEADARWEKQKEEYRLNKIAEEKAKKEANPTGFTPWQDEITVIKEWVKAGCYHPCPADLLALKTKSGLNWKKFTNLSENKWSGWHW